MSIMQFEEVLSAIMANSKPELSLLQHEEGIKKTLDALCLQEGSSYFSVGIGRNVLPLVVAKYGVEVIGVDIDKDSLDYQMELRKRFADGLQNCGNFTVCRLDIDKDPIPDLYFNHFDIVECVNFNFKEDTWELAQILLNLGKADARYFVSSFGGPVGIHDKVVYAITKEARNKGKHSEIIMTNLFTSDKYSAKRDGVILRVY